MSCLKWKKSLLVILFLALSIKFIPAAVAEANEVPNSIGESIEDIVTIAETAEETLDQLERAADPTEETINTLYGAADQTEVIEETEPKKVELVERSHSYSMSFESPKPVNSFEKVPLYLQTDYPDVPYSDGSLATSGCMMTCIAMVASWLRQEEIMPDELARRFGDYDASNVQRMEAASIVLDLEFQKVFHWWDVKESLKQGKVAIILLNRESDFCDVQHSVVATGITPDGKIMIHDPFGPSYEKASLKDGFANGFDQEVITKGFDGAWIYEPYIPPEPAVSRYPEICLTQEERDLLASIVWLESRGEPFEGQQAVAEVVFNRMISGKFSETLTGTIMAEGQFRTAKFVDDAKPGELQYKAIEKALSGPNVLPINVYYFGREVATCHSWGKIGRHYFCYS